MIYTDIVYRDKIDTEKLYKCPACGWIGKTSQMLKNYHNKYNHGDKGLWSDYICPACEAFYYRIANWKMIN